MTIKDIIKSKLFKRKKNAWFLCTKQKNETSQAVKKALKNDGLLLLFVVFPGCQVCSNSFRMTNTSAFGRFLEEKKLSALMIADSESHSEELSDDAKAYEPFASSPFLALVKVKKESLKTKHFSLSKKNGDIEKVYGVSSSISLPFIDDETAIEWINNILTKKEDGQDA